METVTLELPAMFGDHHVIEVRKVLLALTGVTEVYASSAFHVAEITFDPAQISAEAISEALGEAGYLDDLLVPLETGALAYDTNTSDLTYLRHTNSYKQTKKTVSFGQKTAQAGRALWPCPGMGVIRTMDGE